MALSKRERARATKLTATKSGVATKPLKVVIAGDTYWPMANGASYFTQRLAAGLAKRGHEVFVLAPGRERRTKQFERDGVTIYGIGSVPIGIYPNLRITLLSMARTPVAQIISKLQPDVIHIQNHYMVAKAAAFAGRKQGIPVVGTNHFMPENWVHYLHLPAGLERRMVMPGWRWLARLYAHLDGVSMPTHTAADHVESLHIGVDGIIPISCGIDLQRFNPRNSGAYLYERCRIPKSRPMLLYVGRLDKEKRLDAVIRTLPKIAKQVDVQFVIAGVGPQREPLATLASSLGVRGRVNFLGFVPDEDLPNLYCIADAFVMAGVAELQSIVTMEAMASGLPILAVNRNALPELVHHGENGYLFEDGDIDEIATCAIALLSDETSRKHMGQQSLQIVQKHEINETLAKYEQFYRRAIEQHIKK